MATDKIGESDDYSKVFVSSVPTEKHHSKGAWIRELSFEKADIFPVGAIYISLKDTNPSKFFAGTWEQIKGKFLVGVDSSDTDFKTSGKTGGTKDSLLQYVTSGYGMQINSMAFADRLVVGKAGYSQETYDKGNLPPYIAVYMFKRVS